MFTQDAGNTWETQMINDFGDAGCLFRVFGLDRNHAWSVGYGGLIKMDLGNFMADFEADSTLIDPGDDVSFNDLSTGDITSWFWEFEGGNPETSTEQNPMVTYSEPGIYDVSLTISDGNDSQTFVKADYIEVDISIGIDANKRNDIGLYPNPTSGLFQIKGLENMNISVFNTYGLLVASFRNLPGKQINLTQLEPGIYFIEVFSHDNVITKKLVIE